MNTQYPAGAGFDPRYMRPNGQNVGGVGNIYLPQPEPEKEDGGINPLVAGALAAGAGALPFIAGAFMRGRGRGMPPKSYTRPDASVNVEPVVPVVPRDPSGGGMPVGRTGSIVQDLNIPTPKATVAVVDATPSAPTQSFEDVRTPSFDAEDVLEAVSQEAQQVNDAVEAQKAVISADNFLAQESGVPSKAVVVETAPEPVVIVDDEMPALDRLIASGGLRSGVDFKGRPKVPTITQVKLGQMRKELDTAPRTRVTAEGQVIPDGGGNVITYDDGSLAITPDLTGEDPFANSGAAQRSYGSSRRASNALFDELNRIKAQPEVVDSISLTTSRPRSSFKTDKPIEYGGVEYKILEPLKGDKSGAMIGMSPNQEIKVFTLNEDGSRPVSIVDTKAMETVQKLQAEAKGRAMRRANPVISLEEKISQLLGENAGTDELKARMAKEVETIRSNRAEGIRQTLEKARTNPRPTAAEVYQQKLDREQNALEFFSHDGELWPGLNLTDLGDEYGRSKIFYDEPIYDSEKQRGVFMPRPTTILSALADAETPVTPDAIIQKGYLAGVPHSTAQRLSGISPTAAMADLTPEDRKELMNIGGVLARNTQGLPVAQVARYLETGEMQDPVSKGLGYTSKSRKTKVKTNKGKNSRFAENSSQYDTSSYEALYWSPTERRVGSARDFGITDAGPGRSSTPGATEANINLSGQPYIVGYAPRDGYREISLAGTGSGPSSKTADRLGKNGPLIPGVETDPTYLEMAKQGVDNRGATATHLIDQILLPNYKSDSSSIGFNEVREYQPGTESILDAISGNNPIVKVNTRGNLFTRPSAKVTYGNVASARTAAESSIPGYSEYGVGVDGIPLQSRQPYQNQAAVGAIEEELLRVIGAANLDPDKKRRIRANSGIAAEMIARNNDAARAVNAKSPNALLANRSDSELYPISGITNEEFFDFPGGMTQSLQAELGATESNRDKMIGFLEEKGHSYDTLQRMGESGLKDLLKSEAVETSGLHLRGTASQEGLGMAIRGIKDPRVAELNKALRSQSMQRSLDNGNESRREILQVQVPVNDSVRQGMDASVLDVVVNTPTEIKSEADAMRVLKNEERLEKLNTREKGANGKTPMERMRAAEMEAAEQVLGAKDFAEQGRMSADITALENEGAKIQARIDKISERRDKLLSRPDIAKKNKGVLRALEDELNVTVEELGAVYDSIALAEDEGGVMPGVMDLPKPGEARKIDTDGENILRNYLDETGIMARNNEIVDYNKNVRSKGGKTPYPVSYSIQNLLDYNTPVSISNSYDNEAIKNPRGIVAVSRAMAVTPDQLRERINSSPEEYNNRLVEMARDDSSDLTQEAIRLSPTPLELQARINDNPSEYSSNLTTAARRRLPEYNEFQGNFKAGEYGMPVEGPYIGAVAAGLKNLGLNTAKLDPIYNSLEMDRIRYGIQKMGEAEKGTGIFSDDMRYAGRTIPSFQSRIMADTLAGTSGRGNMRTFPANPNDEGKGGAEGRVSSSKANTFLQERYPEIKDGGRIDETISIADQISKVAQLRDPQGKPVLGSNALGKLQENLTKRDNQERPKGTPLSLELPREVSERDAEAINYANQVARERERATMISNVANIGIGKGSKQELRNAEKAVNEILGIKGTGGRSSQEATELALSRIGAISSGDRSVVPAWESTGEDGPGFPSGAIMANPYEQVDIGESKEVRAQRQALRQGKENALLDITDNYLGGIAETIKAAPGKQLPVITGDGILRQLGMTETQLIDSTGTTADKLALQLNREAQDYVRNISGERKAFSRPGVVVEGRYKNISGEEYKSLQERIKLEAAEKLARASQAKPSATGLIQGVLDLNGTQNNTETSYAGSSNGTVIRDAVSEVPMSAKDRQRYKLMQSNIDMRARSSKLANSDQLVVSFGKNNSDVLMPYRVNEKAIGISDLPQRMTQSEADEYSSAVSRGFSPANTGVQMRNLNG